MFSISARCCVNNAETLKNVLIVDAVIGLALCIIAFLGFSEILPLAVGITFCVLGVAQLALTTIVKKLSNPSAP